MVFYDGNWIGVVNDVVVYEELAKNEVSHAFIMCTVQIIQIVDNKFGCSNCTQYTFALQVLCVLWNLHLRLIQLRSTYFGAQDVRNVFSRI